MVNYTHRNQEVEGTGSCPFEVNRGHSRHPCPFCSCDRVNFVGSTGYGSDVYQCDDCGFQYRV